MRYRRPSLNTLLGITAAKKKIKRDLGIYKVTRVINAPKNMERRVKRALGWESEIAKFFRWVMRFFR